MRLETGELLYEVVMKRCVEWHAQYGNIGLVVGATHGCLPAVRRLTDLLFLVPGVGQQGGDYAEVVREGQNSEGLVVVNMTRNLLYASSGDDYLSVLKGVAERI